MDAGTIHVTVRESPIVIKDNCDVLTIKNTGGGHSVVGVVDKTCPPRGLPTALPYDAKCLRDKVRRATGRDLDVDVVQHDAFIYTSTRRFALILIRSSKKRRGRRVPSLAKADFCPRQPFGIRRFWHGEDFLKHRLTRVNDA